MLRSLLAFLMMGLALGGSAAYADGSDREPLVIHGSTTVSDAVMIPKKRRIERASGVDYEIVANGSARGLLAVAEGRAPLGMISADLDVQIAKVSQEFSGRLAGKDLRAHRLGVTEVAFAVHPSNPVTELPLSQITAILEGRIRNWREVGGPDAPIIVIAETKGGGIRSMVETELLETGAIGAILREVPAAPQANLIAAQLPQALAITSKHSVKGDVRVLQTDRTLTQPLMLVTLGKPSGKAAKIIEAARDAFRKATGS